MGLYIKNWSLADWKELLKWAKIGANNAMIGEFTEVEEVQAHGRLIDADALEMERRAENAQKGWHDSFAVVFNGDPYYEAIYDCTEQFKELVNNAPTVIEAEEGE